MSRPDVDDDGGIGSAAPAPLVSLGAAARSVVVCSDPAGKVELAMATGKAWLSGTLSLGTRATLPAMPDRPGRPERPELLPPRAMPRRSSQGERGRIALLHALAHIELNAVDMTWDLVGRFVHEAMPLVFFDNWVQVGIEEAKHFSLLSGRLAELDAAYGDLLDWQEPARPPKRPAWVKRCPGCGQPMHLLGRLPRGPPGATPRQDIQTR